MKNISKILTMVALLIGCSSESKSDSSKVPNLEDLKVDGVPEVNDNFHSPVVGTAPSEAIMESPNLPSTQPQTITGGNFHYTLFKFPLSESVQPRGSAKVFSVQVNALNLISLTGLKPSSIYAECKGQKALVQHFEILLDGGPKVTYQPSLVVPADLVCDTEIEIKAEILGYRVDFSNIYVGDVIELGAPTLVSE